MFFPQNYSMLVMLRPTGSVQEWLAFAVWASLVAAAAAIAFQSAIMTAYRRIAMALE